MNRMNLEILPHAPLADASVRSPPEGPVRMDQAAVKALCHPGNGKEPMSNSRRRPSSPRKWTTVPMEPEVVRGSGS